MSELLKNKHHYFCPLGINGIKIPLLLSITPQITDENGEVQNQKVMVRK